MIGNLISQNHVSFSSPFEEKNVSPRVCITWKNGQKIKNKNLGVGRYLLGDSELAHVQIDLGTAVIVASLFVDENKVELRAATNDPAIIVDHRKLGAGKNIQIPDYLDLSIGSTQIRITTLIPEAKNALKKDSSADVDQNHAAKIFGNTLEDRSSDLRSRATNALIHELNLRKLSLGETPANELKFKASLILIKYLIEQDDCPEDEQLRQNLETEIINEVLGLGPLEPLLADESITEIMVNRRDQIYIEKAGVLSLTDATFSSDQSLLNVIERIVASVGRRVDKSSPYVDARLRDGSRVNAVISPLAVNGACLTIRRFSKKPIKMQDLVNWGSLNSRLSEIVVQLVRQRKNIVVSGGTGSGKTTLLNALSEAIPNDERIITVEDSAELRLQQEHLIALETRPPNLEGKGAVTIRDLVRNTLRMRPDRIIVGECRSGEALDMLQAMNTGHDGSMTTAHANSPQDMLRRLETMVLMAGMDLPLSAIRQQIGSAVHFILQQSRHHSGKRWVTQLTWVRGYDSQRNEYLISDLYRRQENGSEFFDEILLRDLITENKSEGDHS